MIHEQRASAQLRQSVADLVSAAEQTAQRIHLIGIHRHHGSDRSAGRSDEGQRQ